MKILLSAYACEPNKGSEPGVGWNWAIELTKLGHEVWVLTRSNNQHPIEKELSQYPSKHNIHFIYFDLPAWIRKYKKMLGGIYFYYIAWQWGAYQLAKRYHNNIHFDVVHHITFVSARFPSFMGGLGIRFILGPIAGGEKAPWSLRTGYPVRGFILDWLRDLANIFIRVDPVMRNTLHKADKIYVTSQQTKQLIPLKFHSKTTLQLAIGIKEKTGDENIGILSPKPSVFQILFVGRFLYWKGMHIGFQALAEVVKSFPNVKLTMVGEGPEEHVWKKQVHHLGIDSNVNWIPWVPRQKLIKLYQTYQLFLFPSLHDSGGMVILEALAQGLPVICLDIGGPGIIVDNSCGIKIPVRANSSKKIIFLLANKIKILISNNIAYNNSKNAAIKRSKQFSWANIVKQIYD